MAYCSASDVKAWGGWASSDSGDDTVIGLAIPYAQKAIDSYCGRVFECSSDNEATRYYDAVEDVKGNTLLLDKDLCNIVSVRVEGKTISSDHYITEPKSEAPYWGLTVLTSTSDTWQDYATDAVNAIAIRGTWAYSSSAPADIKFATIMLAHWFIKQRNSDLAMTAPIIDASAGVTILPPTVPNIVRQILNSYRRIRFEVA